MESNSPTVRLFLVGHRSNSKPEIYGVLGTAISLLEAAQSYRRQVCATLTRSRYGEDDGHDGTLALALFATYGAVIKLCGALAEQDNEPHRLRLATARLCGSLADEVVRRGIVMLPTVPLVGLCYLIWLFCHASYRTTCL